MINMFRLREPDNFAAAWGSSLVNAGAKGHINFDAGFGEWSEGLDLLKTWFESE